MTRIKPDPHVVESRAQCEGALAEMAALDRKLSAIENDMREAVDGAKAKASQLAGPLQARRKELADAVADLCRRLNSASSCSPKARAWTWALG